MIVVGIDPGKKGGLFSILCHPGVSGSREWPVVLFTRYLSMPSTPEEVLSWVLEHSSRVDVVYVESSYPMPMKGVTPMPSLDGFSEILGVFTALDIHVKGVPPDEWERAVLGGRDKDEATRFVQQEYPTTGSMPDHHQVQQDGVANAICIAHYGMLQEVKNNPHCW